MGGHAGGAVASKLAVDAAVAPSRRAAASPPRLQAANRAVGAKAASDRKLTNMGATFVAAMVNGDEMRWISVGDSPLYLVDDGRIERLNADHSMAPQIDAHGGARPAHRPAGGRTIPAGTRCARR